MVPEPADRARSGKLNPQALKKALFFVETNKFVGNVHVTKGDDEKHIYFTVGGIRLHSRGTRKKAQLGKLLVRYGKITANEMREALTAQKRSGFRLGEVLTKVLKLCTAEDINEVVQRQIENEIYEVITWDEGVYEYSLSMPDSLFDKRLKATTLSTDIPKLIERIKAKIEAWPSIKQKVSDLQGIYKLTRAGQRSLVESEGGDPAARELAPLLDGNRSLSKVVDEGEFGVYEACEVVADLVEKEWAARVGGGETEAGPDRTDTFEEIRMLEKALGLNSGDTTVRARLAAAYEKMGIRDKASLHFRKIAEARIEAYKPESAAELLERAVRLNPTDFEAQELLFEVLTKGNLRDKALQHGLRLAEIYKANRLFNRSKTLLLKLLAWAPKNVKAHTLLAETHEDLRELQSAVREYETVAALLRSEGRDEQRLKEVYERILQVDDRHKSARKELRRILTKGRSDVARTVRAALLAVLAALALGSVAYEYAGRVLSGDLRSRVAADVRGADFASAEKRISDFQSWFPLVARRKMAEAREAVRQERSAVLAEQAARYAQGEAKVLASPTPESVEQAQARVQAKIESEGEALTEAARRILDELVAKFLEFRKRLAQVIQAAKDGQHEKAFADFQAFLSDYPGFRPGSSPSIDPILVPFSVDPPGSDVTLDSETAIPGVGRLAFRIGRPVRLRASRPGFTPLDRTLDLRDARWPMEIRLPKELAWKADLGVPIEVSPVLSVNEVEVCTRDGACHGFDLANGAPRWRARGALRGDSDAAPALRGDGLLVFTGRDGCLHTVRPGEGTRARRPIGALCPHTPLLFDRQEFSGALLGLSDGRVLLAPWDLAQEPRLLFRTDRPLAGGLSEFQGVILAGDEDGRLQAFDFLEGRFKWREAILQGRITASPVVHEGFVYAGTTSGKVYAVDLADGNMLPGWPYSCGAPVVGVPVIHRDLLLVGSEDGYYHALDRVRGVFHWKIRVGEALSSSAAVRDDSAYVGTPDGRLCALDLQNRSLKWTFQTGGAVRAAPLLAGGLIVTGSADGILYAIRE